MGLDMYLTKKTFLWDKQRNSKTIIFTEPSLKHIVPEKICYIEEEVGYWRKANAIHQWFVDNVQEGEDNCQPYYVERKQLENLLETVNQILEDNSKAKELLPTQSGFFFGGTDYDEWYFEDLKLTQKIITAALKQEHGDFYYCSSW